MFGFNRKKKQLPAVGFKISKEAKSKLLEYFNTKSYGETEPLVKSLNDDDDKTYFTEDGIKQIADFLKKQPRNEVSELIEMLKQPDVITKYSLVETAKES